MSYQVRPEDVSIVDSGGKKSSKELGGVAGFLRRHRFKIAFAIAAVELILFYAQGWHHSTFWLVVLGVAVVFGHIMYGRSLPYASLRQGSWIIAFAQGLAALWPVVVSITTFAIISVGIVALLIMMMVLLGERAR